MGTETQAVAPLRRPPVWWLTVTGLAASGVVALANREPLSDYILMSVNDYWDQGQRRSVLLLFLQPILGALLALLLAARPVRAAAAAALAVLGLGGFLTLLGYFGSGITYGENDYGRGLALGLLGSVLMLAAGVAAGFGSASAPPVAYGPAGPLATVVGVVSGVLLLVAVPYLVIEIGTSYWYFLPLAVLLGTAVALSRVVRRLTPAAGGGALVALGLATGMTYADLFPTETFDVLQFRDAPTVALDVVIVVTALLTVAGLVLLGGAGREPGTEPSPAHERPAAPSSEATRHLCVAMHLDGDLARRAMRDVVDGDAKAIAPSLGIDFGVVVRHCLVARNRQRVRDAVLVCAAGIVLVVASITLFQTTTAALRYLVPTLLVAWLAITAEALVARHRVVAHHLSRERFARRAAPVLDGAEERRVLDLERLERGNVTPYGGFFPFVGSGQEVGGWSFALSVLKGSQGIAGDRLEPLAFELGDLYETVRQDVERLDVEGLTVEDRLYVDGEEMAGDRRFLRPGPPPTLRTDIDAEQLGELVRAPERVNRVYRCIRVYGWDGEYVLSVYLNFTQAGQGLFAEARYFLLLPPKPQHVALAQELPVLSVGAVLRTLWTSLRATPRLLVTAVRGLFADLRGLSRPPARADAPAGTVNHGATTSLRELAQGTAYRRYFQRIDSEMTTKIVERQVLDAIARFLREHRIDTAELQERQSAILNYGLIVSGGNVSAGSMAVGQNAQSVLSRIGAAIRPQSEEGAPK